MFTFLSNLEVITSPSPCAVLYNSGQKQRILCIRAGEKQQCWVLCEVDKDTGAEVGLRAELKMKDHPASIQMSPDDKIVIMLYLFKGVALYNLKSKTQKFVEVPNISRVLPAVDWLCAATTSMVDFKPVEKYFIVHYFTGKVSDEDDVRSNPLYYCSSFTADKQTFDSVWPMHEGKVRKVAPHEFGAVRDLPFKVVYDIFFHNKEPLAVHYTCGSDRCGISSIFYKEGNGKRLGDKYIGPTHDSLCNNLYKPQTKQLKVIPVDKHLALFVFESGEIEIMHVRTGNVVTTSSVTNRGVQVEIDVDRTRYCNGKLEFVPLKMMMLLCSVDVAVPKIILEEEGVVIYDNYMAVVNRDERRDCAVISLTMSSRVEKFGTQTNLTHIWNVRLKKTMGARISRTVDDGLIDRVQRVLPVTRAFHHFQLCAMEKYKTQKGNLPPSIKVLVLHYLLK